MKGLKRTTSGEFTALPCSVVEPIQQFLPPAQGPRSPLRREDVQGFPVHSTGYEEAEEPEPEVEEPEEEAPEEPEEESEEKPEAEEPEEEKEKK